MVSIKAVKKLWSDESGVTSTEYALLLAVLSLAGIIAFGDYSTEVQTLVNRGSAAIQDATGMGCADG